MSNVLRRSRLAGKTTTAMRFDWAAALSSHPSTTRSPTRRKHRHKATSMSFAWFITAIHTNLLKLGSDLQTAL